jgi:hypothetical protein
MAMDKNIAALLNTNAYTVGVQFQHSLGKDFSEYTYVTDLPREESLIGSMVLVPTKIRPGSQYNVEKQDSTMLLEAGVRMSIAIVTRVDSEVVIEPDDNIEYAWVISKLDTSNYWTTKLRNKEIIALVQEAYTKNLRRSFAQQVLGTLGDETQQRIKTLLGDK